MSRPQKRAPLSLPFFYGWFVIALTFMTALTVAGIRSSPSVMIHPFELEFGWSRAAIAAAISLNLFLLGAVAPISGRLIDRFGPRAVMLGGLATVALGVAGTTFMAELWQLVLLWGIVVGVGAGASSSVLSATVAHRWFATRRGLVVGILNSANSTGQLIFLPVLMAVTVSAGWRIGSLLLVVAALSLALVILAWMRDDPEDVGLEPYGAEAASAKDDSRPARQARDGGPGVILSEVVRTPTFWLLCSSFFVCGATSNGLISTHLIPHSIDLGISEVTAASTLGIMGGMNFIGTVISGWLTDRVNPRKLLALVYILRGTSLFFLPFVTGPGGLFVFAVIYGLDWFATVPPTVTLTADTFGKRAIGSIYGWVFLSHQTGAALAAFGSGAVRVWLGDYQAAFLAGGVLAMIAAGLALGIPATARQPVSAPVPSAAL